MKTDVFAHMKFRGGDETNKRVCMHAVKKKAVKLPAGIGRETFGELAIPVLKERLRQLRANAQQCAKNKFEGKWGLLRLLTDGLALTFSSVVSR